MGDNIRKAIGILISIGGTCLGVYLGLWLMFVKPIYNCCVAFDAGTLTAVQIFWAIIKCYFGSTVFTVITWLGIVIGSYLYKKDSVK